MGGNAMSIDWDEDPEPLDSLHAKAEAIRLWCENERQRDYIELLEWWQSRYMPSSPLRQK